MRCYVFSIGEKTTDLCCELMAEYGFEVILYKDGTTLWEKLKRFYTEALETKDDEFIRIDADVIPYPHVKNLSTISPWTCAWGFDWYKQDEGSVSIHIMNREITQKVLAHIDEAKNQIRPETYLWRIPEINLDTISATEEGLMGIHGYGQKDQRPRIKQLKYLRNQDYNWDLLERIESL